MLEAILIALAPVIEALAGNYGWLAQIIMIIGIARVCMKPLMAAFEEIVKITPSPKDDEFLGKLLANPIYKMVCFILDWFGSLKLPKAPPKTPPAA